MKKGVLIICLLFSIYGFAQVGIGTTSPNAQLDIRASNPETPTNTDGLLIPKVDAFPVTAPEAEQDGMLIYITGRVTGAGTPTKGFYYWNNALSNWVGVGSIKKIDDLTDGKSDATGSSVFLGVDAGAADDGSDNQNVGVGYQTLFSNTTGYNNVANGYQALYSNTVGSNNTAIGRNTGFNATGSWNVFLGNQAGQNETGNHTLYIENSNADADNALIYGEFDNNLLRVNGRLQLPVARDASGVVGSGVLEIGGALRIDNNEIITNTNTALYLQNDNNGDFHVDNTTLVVDASDNRVGIGTATPATKLQIVGGTDANLSNGSGYIVNGIESGLNMVMDYNEIMARNNGAGSTLYLQYGNNGNLSVDGTTLAVDASANRVGIGTSTPANKLHVIGNQSVIAKIETTDNNGASFAGIRFTRPTQEYYLGFNTSLFSGTDFALVDNTDGGAPRITVRPSGYVGIGTRYPVAKLHVDGGTDASLLEASGYFVIGEAFGENIVIDDNEIMARNDGATSTLHLQREGGDVTVGGSVVHSSDRRLKKDINDLSYGLNEILQLNPKSYYWKNRNQKHKSLGLIAQEVQPILKELVHTADDQEKTLSISYTELIPVLINAIKEQEVKIQTLEQQLSINEALEARLTKLETLLNTDAKPSQITTSTPKKNIVVIQD